MKSFYLDSSDFSTFSSCSSQKLHEVYLRLKQAVQDGLAEVRYSGIHVIEMMQMNHVHLHHAASRFSILEELCGGHCFPMLMDFVHAERKALRQSGQILRSDVTRENDAWLSFETAFESQESLKEFRHTILKIKSILSNRPLRKRVMKTLNLDKKMGPQELGLVLIEMWLQQEDIPFEQDHLFAIEKMLMSKVENELHLSPRHFAYLVDLVELQQGDKFRGSIDVASKSVISKVAAQAKNFRKSKDEVNNVLDWRTEVNALLNTEGVWKDAIENLFDNTEMEDISDTPTGRNLLIANEAYLRERVLSYKEQKLKHSDAIDLLHMMYIPYVDYFRADGDMVEVAREVAKGSNCTIVASSEELLSYLP